MPGMAHHRLTAAGELVSSPPATDGECFPYIRLQDGQAVLCVIEGGAFHTFKVGLSAVGRLGAESAELLWAMAREKTGGR